MTSIFFYSALALLFASATASNYDDYIAHLESRNRRLNEDNLMQYPQMQEALDDFYNKRVDAIQAAHEYSPEEEEEDEDQPDGYWRDIMTALDKVRRMKNDEVPSQNNLWGEHRVSGGAGKGDQFLDGGLISKTEVKTDKLPAYCDPPNPCPLGMDPDAAPSPCDRSIPDTKVFNKQWVLSKMKAGECPCDAEHMRHCTKTYHSMKQRSFDSSAAEGGNPFLSGSKRDGVVAKKAPLMEDDTRKMNNNNPYLQGEALNAVKKDGRNIHRFM